MEKITELTVKYADGSSATWKGHGTIKVHHTHDQLERSHPPKPKDVNIHYVNATLKFEKED